MHDILHLASGSITVFKYSNLETGISVLCGKQQCQRCRVLNPGRRPAIFC